MRTLTRALAVAPFVGLAALAVGVVPASADAPNAAVSTAPASTGDATTTLPNVNISRVLPNPAKFHPNAITVAPVTYTSCTASVAVATITNKTAKPQTLLVKGVPAGTIPAKSGVYLCAEGPAGHKFVFGLQGSTSHLTVTLS
jgi:hypothetical protein